ncbi:MAG: type II toxin-antitoxin system death-on-curing family toxin [Candidatus Methylomirabilia bacterium]
MTRYLSVAEVLELHRRVLERWGGASGLRDTGALESAIAQPRMSFGGEELYPDLPAKVAALCFFLIRNHPFVDGNKRVGHAAMEVFLVLNGYELDASTETQERLMLQLADGSVGRDAMVEWVRRHVRASGHQAPRRDHA